MKNYFLLSFLIVGITLMPFCNNAQDLQLKLSEIKTPTNPGFSLADVSPSIVQKPTNPRGLVASLLSIKDGGALEVSPYWIIKSKSRDELTYEGFNNNQLKFSKIFALSVATFKSDTSSYLSLGARILSLKIHSSESKTKAGKLITQIIENLSLPPNRIDLRKIDTLRNDLENLQKHPIFRLEVAGAWLGYSTKNSYEGLQKSRSGLWMNMCYTPLNSNLEIIALARYINNSAVSNFSKESNLLDLGLSVGFEKSDFSLHGELVFRNDNVLNKSYHRIAAVANYKLNDQIYLVSSFGKNFTEVNNIIALIGVNFGLSKEQLKL